MSLNSKNQSSGNGKTADDGGKSAISEKEVKDEASKAANAALAAQKKAKELKQAAAGAGDPDERQKLTEQAVDAQIEAESFGKTAKYMRSGTFQGMAMGAGVGGGTGIGLGTLTGTLVGGVSSTLIGGLGGGVGALTGALHGPFFSLPKLAGKGIRKVTGNLPGWAATEEQKRALERMLGDVNDTEMPDEKELEQFKNDGSVAQTGDEWYNNIKGSIPSVTSMGGSGQSKSTGDQPDEKGAISNEVKQEINTPLDEEQTAVSSKSSNLQKGVGANSSQSSQKEANSKRDGQNGSGEKEEKEAMQKEIDRLTERNRQLEQENEALRQRVPADTTKKKPRKLESRSGVKSGASPAQPQKTSGHPRKLQTRSDQPER